jgi:hypothetical protein
MKRVKLAAGGPAGRGCCIWKRPEIPSPIGSTGPPPNCRQPFLSTANIAWARRMMAIPHQRTCEVGSKRGLKRGDRSQGVENECPRSGIRNLQRSIQPATQNTATP